MGGQELSVEERNLLSVAYKNAVGSRRASWRIITSVEQKERGKGNGENADWAKEYCGTVEAELDKICGEILNLLENKLVGAASTPESQVFYHKMAGDYYRYIAEFTAEAKKDAAAQKAKAEYQKAMDIATKDLVVTHPIRLGLALNFSVFHYEVLQNQEEACKDSTLIMQLLRDNLPLWTSD